MARPGRPSQQPPNAGVLAANVERLRVARGWTEADLMSRTGLSRSTISAVRRGKYQSASLETAKKLAKAFDVTMEELENITVSTGRLSIEVEAFRKSVWFSDLSPRPSEEELDWVRELPAVVWAGLEPGPRTIAKLIAWRRESRH